VSTGGALVGVLMWWSLTPKLQALKPCQTIWIFMSCDQQWISLALAGRRLIVKYCHSLCGLKKFSQSKRRFSHTRKHIVIWENYSVPISVSSFKIIISSLSNKNSFDCDTFLCLPPSFISIWQTAAFLLLGEQKSEQWVVPFKTFRKGFQRDRGQTDLQRETKSELVR
jgi:hypothetical protein